MAVWKMSRWILTSAVAGAMTVAVASPAQAAPTVRASWNMDTLTNNIMRDSTANPYNHGTATAVTLVPGGFYSFNGTTSIVKVADKPNLDPGAAAITIKVDVNLASAPLPGETYDVIRKGVTTTTGGYYKIELKGKTGGGVTAACIFKDGAKVVGQALGGTVPVGAWQTITCAKTASAVTLTAGTTRVTARTVGSIANASPVYIGGKGDSTDAFHGQMNNLSITIG